MRSSAALNFVPLIGEPAANVPKPDLPPPVELLLAAVARIPSGTDAALLMMVLHALRGSAS